MHEDGLITGRNMLPAYNTYAHTRLCEAWLSWRCLWKQLSTCV